jgi:hypothetical protein
MIYPEPAKGRREDPIKKLNPNIDASERVMLSQARRILRYSRALAEQVRDGIETFDTALIVSNNLNRRHLTGGQKAMACAMIYPEPTASQGGRGKKDQTSNLEETSGFSAKRLQQARSILRFSRALAEQVVAGIEHFDATHRKRWAGHTVSAQECIVQAVVRD